MTKVIPEFESPIELRVVGKVVVVELWVVGEMVVVVLWVVGEVVVWSPIELQVLGEVVVIELCEPEQLECEQPIQTILVVVSD